MSRKGHGPKLDRTGKDFYETPEWCVHDLAKHWKPAKRGVLLDPCAGSGAIPLAAPWRRRWAVWDIRKRAAERAHRKTGAPYWFGDCRKRGIPEDVAAIVTNPPFSDAASIIQWALENMRSGTQVVMLLRLPFLAAKKGREWIATNVPDVYLMSERPSFVKRGEKKGKSDMSEYAWMVWTVGVQSTVGAMMVLPKKAK